VIGLLIEALGFNFVTDHFRPACEGERALVSCLKVGRSRCLGQATSILRAPRAMMQIHGSFPLNPGSQRRSHAIQRVRDRRKRVCRSVQGAETGVPALPCRYGVFFWSCRWSCSYESHGARLGHATCQAAGTMPAADAAKRRAMSKEKRSRANREFAMPAKRLRRSFIISRSLWPFEVPARPHPAGVRHAFLSSDLIELRQRAPHDCHVAIRPVGNGKLDRYPAFTLKKDFVGELARIGSFCIADQISDPMMLLMRAELIFGMQPSATA